MWQFGRGIESAPRPPHLLFMVNIFAAGLTHDSRLIYHVFDAVVAKELIHFARFDLGEISQTFR